MKKIFKSLIEKLTGTAGTTGTPIDMTLGGGPRIMRTAEPDSTLEFNAFWERIARLNGNTLVPAERTATP